VKDSDIGANCDFSENWHLLASAGRSLQLTL
jgi:hypothetical protein